MPAVNPVSFVNPLDPAGSAALQVQQQAIQRQQALAQALQQESLQDTPSNGGRISATQGLARLANALVAKDIYKKTQSQQVDLAMKQGQLMGRMFGIGGQQPTDNISNVPDDSRGTFGSGGVEDDGTLPQTAQSQTPQQPIPQQTPPAQSSPQSYPMSLSGDPVKDYSDYVMNPEEFTKQLIASHAPVDMAKTVAQAQQALARGDMATASALLQNVQKQNYIAPISVRQGGLVYDPITHKIDLQTAQAPEGSTVNYGPDGRPESISQIPGATQAIAAASGARTAGQNANEPITGYDANGNPVFGSKLNAAHGGGGNFRPGLAPGTGEFLGGLGKHGSDYFAGLQTRAEPINNQVYALKQMVNLASGPTVYGPGSEAAVKTAGLLNQVGQAFGVPGSFNDKNVTNQQEMAKWAGQVAANAATAMGLNGSDARFNIALESNPSGHLTNTAIKQVGTQVIGLTQAIGGQAQAGARFAAAHPGPQAQGQFQSAWNKNYDPRIYTWLAAGPQVVKQNMAQLRKTNPADYNALVAKAKWLGDYGALPQ